MELQNLTISSVSAKSTKIRKKYMKCILSKNVSKGSVNKIRAISGKLFVFVSSINLFPIMLKNDQENKSCNIIRCLLSFFMM